MYGVSIDDEPDAAVGSPATRRTIAIHWEWTTEYSRERMAKALGVKKSTIDRYIREGPTEEVEEQLADKEAEVRLVAVAELKQQLKAAGSRSRTAKKPVKIYETDDGQVEVKDVTDDMGEVMDRVPVVQDYDLLPDEEARYYARSEAREILDQLTDLVGASEPDEHAVEHSGTVDFSLSAEEKEDLASAFDAEPDT